MKKTIFILSFCVFISSCKNVAKSLKKDDVIFLEFYMQDATKKIVHKNDSINHVVEFTDGSTITYSRIDANNTR